MAARPDVVVPVVDAKFTASSVTPPCRITLFDVTRLTELNWDTDVTSVAVTTSLSTMSDTLLIIVEIESVITPDVKAILSDALFPVESIMTSFEKVSVRSDFTALISESNPVPAPNVIVNCVAVAADPTLATEYPVPSLASSTALSADGENCVPNINDDTFTASANVKVTVSPSASTLFAAKLLLVATAPDDAAVGAVVSITIAGVIFAVAVRFAVFPASSLSVADEPRAIPDTVSALVVSLAPIVYSFVTVLTPFNSAAVMFNTSPVLSVTFKPFAPARVTLSVNVRVILISSPTVYEPAALSVLTATAGTVVSIVNVCVAATLVLPAASAAVTDTEFPPFASMLSVPVESVVPTVILQVPLVAVVSYVAPAKTTVTVEPTSAVPVISGVVSVVKEALVIVGTPGITVSITNSCAVDEVTFPAVSVDVAIML